MWTIRFAKSRMRESRTSGILWGVYDRKGCTYSTHERYTAGRSYKTVGNRSGRACSKEDHQDSFIVINADDYYGKEGFKAVHEYLLNSGKSCMAGFVDFFKNEVPADPMKAEYLIPTFIGELLAENKMSVKVLRSNDTWYGMTYKEDVVTVKENFEEMLKTEVYKEDLFSDL